MPRYKTQKNKKVPNVTTHKAWFEIPTKDGFDAYLVPTRVADYIEKLENKIIKLKK